MDRKSIIILIAAVLLLFLLNSSLFNRLFPPVPVRAPAQPTAATNLPAATASNVPAQPLAAATAAPLMAQPSGPEKIVVVSNQDLVCHFTSHGGGLKLIELTKYPSTIDCARNLPAETNLASLNTKAPVPVLALLGSESIQGDNLFALSQIGDTVRAEKTLSNGLRVVKEFQVGSNYLLTAKLRLENTSAAPLALSAREIVAGTATPMGPTDDPTTIGAFWYNGVKAEEIKDAWFANRTLGCIPGVPRTDYEGGASNVVWAAVHNQFFTLAAVPSETAPQVRIHKVSLPPPGTATPGAASTLLTNGYETTLFYPATVLTPHQAIEHTYTFYAGPKEYNRLAQLGQKLNNNLDLIMGFSGFFGFFSKFLLLSMNALHALGLGYGWAIIAITVIIKLLFWPLTNASTKSMKRMQALQPQIKAIQEKYKDDAVKKNQKTMEFYKEHKVNPLGGCLPMLLQIPVFFGFYWMLRSAIELRGVHFLWACDLSQADTVAYVGPLPFLGVFPLNPMPLIMGVTMLWQARLTPVSPGMDPAQQKLMRYMPLMFILILYKMSAGLTLYWTVQNLLTIAQTKVTKTTNGGAAPPPGKPAPFVPPKKKK